MFTWILIAVAIAFIFGVIKVEQVKDFAKKCESEARKLFNKTKDIVTEKVAEAKKKSESQKTASTTESSKKQEDKNSDIQE